MINYWIRLFSPSRAFLDFDAYWDLTRQALNGINPYAVSSMQSMAPPLVHLYYLPYLLLPLSLARGVNTALNIAAGVAVAWLLGRKLSKRWLLPFLLIAVILFTAFPFRFSLEQGQPIALLTLILLGAERTKGKLAGLFIALSASLKPFLALASFFKTKKVLFWTIIWTAALVAFSLVVIRPEWYLYYFENKFGSIFMLKPEIQGLDYYNQSIRSSLHRVGLSEIYLPVYVSAWLAFFVFALAVPGFWVGVVLSMILSPIVWQHYLVLAFPLFISLWPKVRLEGMALKIIYALAVILWWVEFPGLHTANLNLATGALASHHFISLVILLYLVFRLRTIN